MQAPLAEQQPFVFNNLIAKRPMRSYSVPFLAALMGLGLTGITVVAQDSSRLGGTVRVIRAYDPHLPEWFRIYNDPVVPVQDKDSLRLTYSPSKDVPKAWTDSVNLSFPKGLDSIAWISKSKGSLNLYLSSNVLNQYGGGIHWIQPWTLLKNPALLRFELGGNNGAWNNPWLASAGMDSSIVNLVSMTPRFLVAGHPLGPRLGRFSLEGGAGIFAFNKQVQDGRYTMQWLQPRWHLMRQSKRLDGLYYQLDFSSPWYRQARLVQEQALHSKNTVGYTTESYDLSLGVGVRASWLVPDRSGTVLGGGRSSSQWALSPRWIVRGKHLHLELGSDVTYLKDTLQDRWWVLPHAVLRGSHASVNTKLPRNLNWELGIRGQVLQPDLQEWGRRYATLSGWDTYTASVSPWELFAGLDRSGPGFARWKHSVSLSEWRNARFFQADSSRPFGVISFNFGNCYRFQYESEVRLSRQEFRGWDFRWGGMALFRDRTREDVPGLHPAAYLSLRHLWSASQGWSGYSKVACFVSSPRADFKNPKEYPLAWNLDVELRKEISGTASWFVAYKLRQSPWLFRWTEEAFWGNSLQGGLKWNW